MIGYDKLFLLGAIIICSTAIGIIYLLRFKCKHEWAIYKFIPVYREGYPAKPVRYDVTLQCKKCGNLKTKKV